MEFTLPMPHAATNDPAYTYMLTDMITLSKSYWDRKPKAEELVRTQVQMTLRNIVRQGIECKWDYEQMKMVPTNYS